MSIHLVRVFVATSGLALIGVAGNPRLSAVAGSAAVAIWATRISYAGLLAMTLLAVVGCFSILI